MKYILKKIACFLRFCWIQLARRVLIILTYLLYCPKVIYTDKAALKFRRVAEPTVLTCNHLRGCDGAVISVIFYRSRIHSLAARKWYRKWYLKPLLVCGYSIPIAPSSTSWLKEAVRAMRGGDSVLIFPEGMAVSGGEAMRPFKPGFLKLAELGNAPVLPIYMEGCYNRPFLKHLRLVVGSPYRPDPIGENEHPHDYQKRQSALLYAKTKELQEILHQRKKRKDKQ